VATVEGSDFPSRDRVRYSVIGVTWGFSMVCTLVLAMASAWVAAGCGPGDGASSGSGSDSGAESTGQTDSAGQTSTSAGTEATSEGGSEGSGSSGGGSSTTDDTGTVSDCDERRNCTLFPLGCDVVQCGGLSPFDDDGCVRTNCTANPSACGAGERCYAPIDFGGCLSSAFECYDEIETQTCQCGSDPDCGGAFCIPEELYPEVECFDGEPTCPPADEVVAGTPCAEECAWCESEASCSGFLMCVEGQWTLVNPC
jgi:hypothetical protein